MLLADLRVALRDPGAADDIPKLFAKLRKRRDLFATFADEIDDLLAKSGNLKSDSVGVQQLDLASLKALDPSLIPTLSAVKEVNSVRDTLKRLRWPETRLGAALRAAIFGSVVVVVYLGLAGVYSSEPFFFKFVTLMAIAGAILGKKGWASLVAGSLVVGIFSLGTALQKPGYEAAIGSGIIALMVAIVAQAGSWIYALIARLR